MKKFEKMGVSLLITLTILSLLFLPAVGSSISEIEGKKADKNIDTTKQSSKLYINFFCKIEIEGKGIISPPVSGESQHLITLSWKTIGGNPKPTIHVRGFFLQNNLDNDNAKSLGYCLNFRGDIWQDTSSEYYRISGRAAFAVYSVEELD